MNSRNIWQQIKTETIRDEYASTYVLWLKDTFENSENYFQVTKNFDYDTNYDVLIKDYNAFKNIVPTKTLISYPYDTFVFDIGDYINWTYGGESTIWLIIYADKQYNSILHARMQECKSTLEWYDGDNNEVSYPCIITDDFTNTAFAFYKQMIISKGSIVVMVKADETTNAISFDDRFVFDGQSFMVEAMNNFASQNIITLLMRKDGIAYDDTTIANSEAYEYTVSIDAGNFTQIVGYTSSLTSTIILNDEETSKDVTWSSSDDDKVSVDEDGNVELLAVGASTIRCALTDNTDIYDEIIITVSATLPVSKYLIFNPNIDNIKQGSTQTFTVYKYVDDVQAVDTFTITAAGISTDYYTLTVISGNSFSIENLKVNYDTNLVVTCVSDVDATTDTLTLEMKGIW